MKLAIIDTETSGLDPTKDTCIEVAACLYDTIHQAPLEYFASLMRADSNPAVKTNRIPVELLAHAPGPSEVWTTVENMLVRADVVIAHNAKFDREFFPKDLQKLRPWCCSCQGIPWPVEKPESSLVNLALALGIGVLTAHRAMADVDTLVRIFQRGAELGFDIDELVKLGLRPRKRYVAIVPYAQKDLAKDAGFKWDGDKREWWREMIEEDATKLPFKVKVA